MKNCNILKLLILFFTGTFLLSCGSDDTNNVVVDYKLLGINTVTINGMNIPVKSDGVFLDVSAYKEIVNTGVLDEYSKKRIQVNYTILTTNITTPSVQIQSRYPDTSIEIVPTSSSQLSTYTIHITRKGYQEQITYVLNFLVY